MARQHSGKGAKGSFWPTVSVVGLYQVLWASSIITTSFSAASFRRNNFDNRSQMYTFRFSAPRRFAEVKLAKSQLQRGRACPREQTPGSPRWTCCRKRATFANSTRLSRSGAAGFELAQESLQIVQAKFDQGRATLRDIEQARLDENDKWVAFLDADFARQQGQLTLLQATGQLAKVFQ